MLLLLSYNAIDYSNNTNQRCFNTEWRITIMGTQVKFDYSLTNGIVSEDEIKSMAKIANMQKMYL